MQRVIDLGRPPGCLTDSWPDDPDVVGVEDCFAPAEPFGYDVIALPNGGAAVAAAEPRLPAYGRQCAKVAARAEPRPLVAQAKLEEPLAHAAEREWSPQGPRSRSPCSASGSSGRICI